MTPFINLKNVFYFQPKCSSRFFKLQDKMNAFFNKCISSVKNQSEDEFQMYSDDYKFNDKFKIPELTLFLRNSLEKCASLTKPSKVPLNEIIDKSSQFPIKFPINTCRVEYQPKERHPQIEFQANSVRPILHERAFWLYLNFLEYKTKFGDETEKIFYESMGICELVQRLLQKRCICFYGSCDTYKLLNGKTGDYLYSKPIPLEECISYEEVKLSALLSVSSHTELINNGSRRNMGKIEENKSLIEGDGVIIGLIGARFARAGEMEYQDIVIEKTQNCKENGYGYKNSNILSENVRKKLEYRKIWNKFYNENDFEYKKAKKFFKNSNNHRLVTRPNDNAMFFDTLIMKKRFEISFDTLLLEAESRAAASGKQAYIHVVGIGLGVWKAFQEQDYIFMETFGKRIETLQNQLNHIGFIHFSWFLHIECNGIKDNEIFPIKDHPNGGIKLFFSHRNPHEKLENVKYPNCLLVVSYAWDGNALPGNEFWNNSLGSSSDPAAACSTLITELHNAHINEKICNGNNLYVASDKYGVIHVAEYAKQILNF